MLSSNSVSEYRILKNSNTFNCAYLIEAVLPFVDIKKPDIYKQQFYYSSISTAKPEYIDVADNTIVLFNYLQRFKLN